VLPSPRWRTADFLVVLLASLFAAGVSVVVAPNAATQLGSIGHLGSISAASVVLTSGGGGAAFAAVARADTRVAARRGHVGPDTRTVGAAPLQQSLIRGDLTAGSSSPHVLSLAWAALPAAALILGTVGTSARHRQRCRWRGGWPREGCRTRAPPWALSVPSV